MDNTSYNPNGTWTSKEKKYEYKPHVAPPSRPTDRFASPEIKDGHDGNDRDNHDDYDDDHDHGRKKIWIASVIVIVMVIVGVAAYFILKPAPALNVSVTIGQPGNAVLVGDPFILPVSYANNSQAILQGATLAVTLPNGVSFASQSPGQRVMDVPLGDVGPGSSDEQDFNLIATGNPNSVANISAQLTYDPDQSGNAQYGVSAQNNVVVGGPAIGLTITTPTDVASGQDFTITVAYVNNAAHQFNDVKIDLQYPPVFAFGGSSASPDSASNDEWDLGPLDPGTSGSFTITGIMIGQDDAFYSITGTATADGNTVASQAASLAIAASPLTITAALNNSSDYVAGLADDLSYTFSYTNNSNTTLQNAVITAKFIGAMFNFASLRSNGSFSSLTNTLMWSGANTPALLSIAPGQSGEVNVDLRTLSAFPIRLPSDKDYLLKANVQIVSPTVSAGTAASSTISVTSVTNQVGGAVALAAVGYFHDPDSAEINNLGIYPPQVNQATQYTIHWRITNYSTDIANVTVSAYLQSGTTCTGFATSTIASSTPICNSANGLVSWTIPEIPATTGVISPPAEAIFQVENTPAVNEVGHDVVLLGPTSLTATDEFTSATLTANVNAVDTSLPNDVSAASGNRQVTE